MGRLIYGINMSLDGFIEDADGRFDWSEPPEDLHRFFNDLIRPIGTHLLGRRMYETMAVWETELALAAASDVMREFAELWQAADKVVYSRTLAAPWTARTRLERELDLDMVRALKATQTRDILIEGPEIAAPAIRAGLVDDYHFVLAPVAVGAGKRALPSDVRLDLELKDERRFSNGAVHLHYVAAG